MSYKLSDDGVVWPAICRVPYGFISFVAIANLKLERSPRINGFNPEPNGLSHI